MRRQLRMALASLLVLVASAGPLLAAEVDTESILVARDTDTAEFPRISISVTIPANLLSDTDAEPSFRVFENDVEFEPVSVEPLAGVRAPMDIVLLMDTSGSMRGDPMDDARTAASAFVAAMGPEDEFALVAFDSEARVLADFTSERRALESAIASLEAEGRTVLYDAVIKGSDLLLAREGRDRVVVLLSDGGDNGSVSSIDQAVTRLRASDAPMYAIGLDTPDTDMEALATMAAQSRGRLIGVSNSGDLERLYVDIARELTTQYRITYESAVPSTKDLELSVVAEVDGRRGSTTFVIENPYFTAASGEGPTTVPASPYASTALGLLVVSLASSSVALGAWALLSIFGRRSSRLDELRFYDQLRGVEDKSTTRAAGITGVIKESVEVVAGRRGLTPLVHRKLEQAGLPLRPAEYMYFHIVGVVIAGLVTQLLTRSLGLSIVVVVFVVTAPIFLLENAMARRKHAFEEQLPEILSLIAGSLRAGWGVGQSIDLVVQEMSDPAASEFKRVQAEARLGLSVEEALEKMADRLDSDDFRWTVTAIAIQRDVGGNLAEVLDLVANTMRERAELRRHVRALTSEGRLSAIILFLLPFVMLVLLLIVNPGYMSLMLSTGMGLVMLGVGAVLLIVGGIWLRRASEVEI